MIARIQGGMYMPCDRLDEPRRNPYDVYMTSNDELDRIAAKLIEGLTPADLAATPETDIMAAMILDDCDEWDEDQVTDDELMIIHENPDAIFDLIVAKLNSL